MELQSRRTLDKARFFLAQAVRVGTDDREAYIAFLEAALIFGRSVTFHLQKELAYTPGFDVWYSGEQSALSADPLAKYFLEQRNYLLKEGSLEIRLHTDVQMEGVVAMTGSLTFVVTRGQPWYRRPPRILVHDAIRPIRVWFESRRERARARKFIKDAQTKSNTVIRRVVRFAESPFGETPVDELFERYFDALDGAVSRAEKRFPA